MQPDRIPGLKSLSSLPLEILEEILSEIDQVNDILSLAYTSRANASLVIPQHTEYRKIRIRTPMAEMWAHLAQRADLACNIREVHLCARQDYTASDRFPVTLVNSAVQYDDEEIRIKHMCIALGHMRRLSTFVWNYEPDVKAGLRLNHQHEEMVLASLGKLPNLRHLMLAGQCGAHVWEGKGTQRQPYPLWKISGLESLSLIGPSWAKHSNSLDVIRFIQRSPNIEVLEIPMEVHGLDTCHLPHLKRVRLPMTIGIIGGIIASNPLVGFMEKNPSIEELNWSPTLPLMMSPDALPNLRRLKGNTNVFRALERTETVQRPIESLELWGMRSDSLALLQSFDVATVRELKIASVGSLKSLHTIAERFTGIAWLHLPPQPFKFDLVRDILAFLSRMQNLNKFIKSQLLDILSRFKNLEVFRGPVLWEAIGGEAKKEKMHEVILDLIERCPRLRQLDHCSRYEKRNAIKVIKIYRREDVNGVEQVWYDVQRPPPQNAFDVMMKAFD